MKKPDYLDMAIDYIGQWGRYRSFSTYDTLQRELKLSKEQLREFMKACKEAGLANRRNKTANNPGGLEWIEREVRPLMNARRAA